MTAGLRVGSASEGGSLGANLDLPEPWGQYWVTEDPSPHLLFTLLALAPAPAHRPTPRRRADLGSQTATMWALPGRAVTAPAFVGAVVKI